MWSIRNALVVLCGILWAAAALAMILGPGCADWRHVDYCYIRASDDGYWLMGAKTRLLADDAILGQGKTVAEVRALARELGCEVKL